LVDGSATSASVSTLRGRPRPRPRFGFSGVSVAAGEPVSAPSSSNCALRSEADGAEVSSTVASGALRRPRPRLRFCLSASPWIASSGDFSGAGSSGIVPDVNSGVSSRVTSPAFAFGLRPRRAGFFFDSSAASLISVAGVLSCCSSTKVSTGRCYCNFN